MEGGEGWGGVLGWVRGLRCEGMRETAAAGSGEEGMKRTTHALFLSFAHTSAHTRTRTHTNTHRHTYPLWTAMSELIHSPELRPDRLCFAFFITTTHAAACVSYPPPPHTHKHTHTHTQHKPACASSASRRRRSALLSFPRRAGPAAAAAAAPSPSLSPASSLACFRPPRLPMALEGIGRIGRGRRERERNKKSEKGRER